MIGLGRQAQTDHLPALLSCPDIELVAVAEIKRDILEHFSGEHPEVAVFNDPEEMLKQVTLDFVVISLPHFLHYDITRLALERGIHVLKEKPYAMNVEEGFRLKTAAEEHNKVLSISTQRRFNPVYSNFFHMIDKIGKVFFIDILYSFRGKGLETGWRTKKSLAGGGAILDMGYHFIDILIWYFGLPDEIMAQVSSNARENIEYDVDDTANVMFSYEEEQIHGRMFLSDSVPPKQEHFNIYGTRGSIHINKHEIARCSSNGDTVEMIKRETTISSLFFDQLDYFLKVIGGEKENIASPAVHLQHIAFIEAAYRSAAQQSFCSPKMILSESEIAMTSLTGDPVPVAPRIKSNLSQPVREEELTF